MAPLQKLYSQLSKNGYDIIVQRGDPLRRQEVESLKGEGTAFAHPLNPLVATDT